MTLLRPARAFEFVNPKNSSFDVRVPADRIPKNSSEVFPKHVEARILEMMNWAGVKVLPPNQANVSYTYEKNSTLTKEEIVSKLNMLLESPSVSVPQVVDLFNKPGESLNLVV